MHLCQDALAVGL